MRRRRLTGKTSTSGLLDEIEVGRGCIAVGGLLVVRHGYRLLLFASMCAVGESVLTKGVRSLLLGLLLLLMSMLMVKRTRNKKQETSTSRDSFIFKVFSSHNPNQPPRGVPGQVDYFAGQIPSLPEYNVRTFNSLMSNTHQQESQWC